MAVTHAIPSQDSYTFLINRLNILTGHSLLETLIQQHTIDLIHYNACQ